MSLTEKKVRYDLIAMRIVFPYMLDKLYFKDTISCEFPSYSAVVTQPFLFLSDFISNYYHGWGVLTLRGVILK